MSDKQASIAWIGLPEAALLWERFDDEYLVYNRRSGQTHFLNATAAEVLKLLQTEASTPAMLEARISKMFDMEEGISVAQYISGVIQEFDHAGLICPSLV
jgi:PqqD family protein of HPr-rel-A system